MKKSVIVLIILLVIALIFGAGIAFYVNCSDGQSASVTYNGVKISDKQKIILPAEGEAKFKYNDSLDGITVKFGFAEDADNDLTPLFSPDINAQNGTVTLKCSPGAFSLENVLNGLKDTAAGTENISESDYPFMLTFENEKGKTFTVYFAQANMKLSQQSMIFYNGY